MYQIWMLSQFYTDPLHSVNLGVDLPVCLAYGENFHCFKHPETPDGWGLVHIWATLQHIEAARQDPRIIVCGREYDAVPAKVLEVYKDLLDPDTTYMLMGQVIAKLAQAEPSIYQEF